MKRERVYVEGRRNHILEILKQQPQIRIEELAKMLNVSVITIRRDLQHLEDHGFVSRFYGGAKVIGAEYSPEDEVALYRMRIAQYAAKFIEDGDTLFLNTSMNALDVLRYTTSKNVTVITNNGKAITLEPAEGVNVILTGGELRYPKDAMVGDFAVSNLQNVFAKKAFIGCSGFSAKNGLTTENANEVVINSLMIQNTTKEVYLLADHTKIGHNSSFLTSGANRIHHLITDEKASEEELEKIREKGIVVHQVTK